jgi:hypothetical protein
LEQEQGDDDARCYLQNGNGLHAPLSSLSSRGALESPVMTPPQIAAEVRPRVRELRIRIPESWAVALEDSAVRQGVSVSALVRLILGPFVRERLQ